jgi:hypothetical protein
MFITRRAALALSVSALIHAATRSNLNVSMRLSFVGLGPLRIGMTEAQIRRTVAGPLQHEGDNDEGCYYLTPQATGLGFMFLESRLARIDMFEGEWRTVSGARIGSTEEQVRRLYGGRLHIEPHHYNDDGKYLIVLPAAGPYRGYELLFETDGKVVTTFRAGTAEAVTLVEGCS